jgi:hypothetical protein
MLLGARGGKRSRLDIADDPLDRNAGAPVHLTSDALTPSLDLAPDVSIM